MSTITLKGNPVNTSGSLPALNTHFKDVTLTTTELSKVSIHSFLGHRLIFNIFPSVDTSVCAASVRAFNKEASSLDKVKVLCISRDLPFAQSRFCGAEGLNNVVMLSDYLGGFGKLYGVEMIDGPLVGLLARSIVVADEKGTVIYTEQVPDITSEPNYKAALATLK